MLPKVSQLFGREKRDMCLREAFAQAKLPAEIEVYAGTLHGWCPPDSQVYNAEQAEKAWARMLALFKTALAYTAITKKAGRILRPASLHERCIEVTTSP